jgi:hypothetical protein
LGARSLRRRRRRRRRRRGASEATRSGKRPKRQPAPTLLHTRQLAVRPRAVFAYKQFYVRACVLSRKRMAVLSRLLVEPHHVSSSLP